LQDITTVHVSGWTSRLPPGSLDEAGNTAKRHVDESWEWRTQDGQHRSYLRRGPITEWDDGERTYKYNADDDSLYIGKSNARVSVSKDVRSSSWAVAARLDRLRQRGVKVTDTGARRIGERTAKGVRTVKGHRASNIWFDTDTNLLLREETYALESGRWVQALQGSVYYDQDVPRDILGYVPPDTKNITYSLEIDPRFERWNLHLRRVAAHYQQHPLPETMELLPCESKDEIDRYSRGRLPGVTDATGYVLQPVRSSLADFLRRRVGPDGSLRVPEDLQKIRLNYDLITSKGHSSRERADFVLATLGLEIVEVTEQRDVWVARHDGRPLKPWQEVRAPAAWGQARATQPGMDRNSQPHSMKHLLDSFTYYQGYDLTADKIIVVDETGLPSEAAESQSEEDVAVSSASPYWRRDESIEIARKWFKEQFGVTFVEESRLMTVYLVRKRQP
ncbi:MAG: hypothetical protein ACYS8Z_24210, partial [Planctomycetota bacterium]